MKSLRPRVAAFILTATALTAGVGCSYYEITDPSTGDVYYTTEQKVYKNSGSIIFKDATNGDRVTLTGSKVRKLKEKDWKAKVAEQQAE